MAQLKSWNGSSWVKAELGTTGSTGPTGPTGPTGTVSVSGSYLSNSGSSTAASLSFSGGVSPYTWGHRKYIASNTRGYGVPTVLAALTFAAGNITFVPFVVSTTITVSKLACYVTTAQSGSTLRMGIYSSDSNDKPANLVLDAGTVASTTTGAKYIEGLSQSLSPGLYWLASLSVASVSNPAFMCVATGVILPFTPNEVALTNTLTRWQVASTSFTSTVSPTLTTSSAGCPYIWVCVA